MDDLALDEFDPLEHIRSGSNRCSVASDDDCDAPPSPYMGAEHPIKPAAVIAIPTRDSLRATNVQSSSLPTHLPGNNFRHTYLMRVLRSDQPSPSQQSASPGAPLLYWPHFAVIPANTPHEFGFGPIFFFFAQLPRQRASPVIRARPSWCIRSALVERSHHRLRNRRTRLRRFYASAV